MLAALCKGIVAIRRRWRHRQDQDAGYLIIGIGVMLATVGGLVNTVPLPDETLKLAWGTVSAGSAAIIGGVLLLCIANLRK